MKRQLQFDTVSVSYPYVAYTLTVDHATPQEASLFEWLVLSVIQKGNAVPAYRTKSLYELVEQFFFLENAESFLKKTITSLRRAKAIMPIAEEEKPHEPVSAWRVTQQGEQILKNWQSPGSSEQDTLTLYYSTHNNSHPFSVTREGKLAEKPSGALRFPFDAEKDFPDARVQDFLQKLTGKQRKQLDLEWLKDNTSLSVSTFSADVKYRNDELDVVVDENLRLTVEGKKGSLTKAARELLDEQLLAYYAACARDAEGLPDITERIKAGDVKAVSRVQKGAQGKKQLVGKATFLCGSASCVLPCAVTVSEKGEKYES